MMDKLRVLIPSKCLIYRSGFLVGIQDVKKGVCCITNLLELSEGTMSLFVHLEKYNNALNKNKNKNFSIVGFWNNEVESGSSLNLAHDVIQNLAKDRFFIYLHKYNADLPKATTHGYWKSKSKFEHCILLLYDANKLSKSTYFMESVSRDGQMAPTDDKTSQTHIRFLSYCVQQSLHLKMDLTPLKKFVSNEQGNLDIMFQLISNGITLLASSVICFISYLFDTRLLKASHLRTALVIPSVTCQLEKKFMDIKSALNNRKGTGQNCNEDIPKLRAKNVFWRQVLDISLGILVLMWLIDGNKTNSFAASLMTWAEKVAAELLQLLAWMMGVPAGLKLNSQLAHFLGKFFMYHIYLWTGYLRFLRPLWSDALWYISWSGCLGLSVQLSLVQDLISMMTLHIYCFYVYAARLYSLQVSALSSLWRLFRGKKWNPLRARVDSTSFDIDQLFVGTLIFTILLFLLPTTALYYVVFAGLRLVVLGLQGAIYKIVSFFNKLPVCAIFLWITDSSTVTDDVLLHVLPRASIKPLCFAVEFVPASFSTLFQSGNLILYEQSQSYSWSKFLSMLFYGHLIYPWIEAQH